MDTQRQPSPRRNVAILSRGDAVARRDAAPTNGRFVDVFEALAAVGVEARPAIYDESFAEDVRQQLLAVDGVLVWVNPIQDGRNRVSLDAMLRDVANRGVWVSAHPDVILKMGTKEVLYRTRSMGWGCDTALYQTAETMRASSNGLKSSSARLTAAPAALLRTGPSPKLVTIVAGSAVLRAKSIATEDIQHDYLLAGARIHGPLGPFSAGVRPIPA